MRPASVARAGASRPARTAAAADGALDELTIGFEGLAGYSRWVPETLKKMDGVWWAFNNGGDGELRMDGNSLERAPSSYFDTNCTMGASFPSRDEAEAIKELGGGNVMWGSDYPHREGTYPDSVASLRHVFHDWAPADLHELFGGTAAKLFGIEAC